MQYCHRPALEVYPEMIKLSLTVNIFFIIWEKMRYFDFRIFTLILQDFFYAFYVATAKT